MPSNSKDDPHEEGDAPESAQTGFDEDSPDPMLNVITLGSSDDSPWLFVAVGLLVACIAGSILGKKALRRRRFGIMCRQDGPEQVRQMYRFFLTRFDKIGLGKPASQTTREFATTSADATRCFSTERGTSFDTLTATFEAVNYGGAQPAEDELESFRDFYGNFYKGCLTILGRFRYARKFFAL